MHRGMMGDDWTFKGTVTALLAVRLLGLYLKHAGTQKEQSQCMVPSQLPLEPALVLGPGGREETFIASLPPVSLSWGQRGEKRWDTSSVYSSWAAVGYPTRETVSTDWPAPLGSFPSSRLHFLHFPVEIKS